MRLRRLAEVVSCSAKKLAPTAATLTAEIASTSRSRIPRGTHLCIGADQPVAGGANGLDRGLAVGFGELAPEIADVDVEHVRARVVVIAPDRVQDLSARKHLVRVAHQIRQ